MGKRHSPVRAYRKAARHGGNPAILARKVNRFIEAKYGFAEPAREPAEPSPIEQSEDQEHDHRQA